ncbi:uncharacterized protein LOC117100684 [Anneissia japonica]|uniref:uncharacterized protein LOC117100684 n=1 Tax=Anneissia japonica TaxID=1529436 RepID=UPI0014257E1D|nr:uncharacterized protein LOC117100684 [Anneissia japonica]
MGNVEAYMEYDRSSQQSKKYYKLDLDKPIEENLKGKLVIEFPTVHVVLKGDADVYKTKVLTEDIKNEVTNINHIITSPSRKESVQNETMEDSSEQVELEEERENDEAKVETVEDLSIIAEQREQYNELVEDVRVAHTNQHRSNELEEGEISDNEEVIEG